MALLFYRNTDGRDDGRDVGGIKGGMKYRRILYIKGFRYLDGRDEAFSEKMLLFMIRSLLL